MLPKGILASYPLQWFNENNWQKPTVTIPKVRDKASISAYYHYIVITLKNDPVSVRSALVFLGMLLH